MRQVVGSDESCARCGRTLGGPEECQKPSRTPCAYARLCPQCHPQCRLPPLAKLACRTSLVATGCGLQTQLTPHVVAHEPREYLRVSSLLRHLASFGPPRPRSEFNSSCRAAAPQGHEKDGPREAAARPSLIFRSCPVKWGLWPQWFRSVCLLGCLDQVRSWQRFGDR
jgi:hypothetical protein